MQEFYSTKSNDYYKHARNDIADLIPSNCSNILDIGCGTGATIALYKKKYNPKCTLYGVELFDDAAKVAKDNLEFFEQNDLEKQNISFPKKYFDCLILADVLEHTIDPWVNLEYAKDFIKDDGTIIVSLPNLRFIIAVLKIIFDKFDYEDEGVLDRTHLRFFTLSGMKKMFQKADLEIVSIGRNKAKSWKFTLLSIFTLGLLSEMYVYQYLFVLKKKTK
jgi:SAM-dependent methyltransferase